MIKTNRQFPFVDVDSPSIALSRSHYVKTSNRSRIICSGPLTTVTCTHICNGCCLAPVTHKRARMTPGLASTMPGYQCGLLVTSFLNACYMNSLYQMLNRVHYKN
jgi:hypothetical protein